MRTGLKPTLSPVDGRLSVDVGVLGGCGQWKQEEKGGECVEKWTACVIKCGAEGTVPCIQTNLNDMQRGWLIKIQGINSGKSSRWLMEIKKDEVMEEEGEEVKDEDDAEWLKRLQPV